MIREGLGLLRRALARAGWGPYALQAAIAGVHAEAPAAAATDWARIVELYDLLLRLQPSPVVALNRAVALAMRDGPHKGLPLIEELLARGELANYHLAHSARAELCRRLGKTAEAVASFRRALALTRLAPERRFLEGRLRALEEKAAFPVEMELGQSTI
jgi:RNA polymerase sigma-70 factor (ECF subfamily)